MEVKILPCRPTEAGGRQVPLYWIKIKKSALFLIGNLLFHEGNATKKCASSKVFALDHGVGSVIKKLVNLIYMWFFFFTLATLLFERWFGGPPVGVYNSFLLTIKYVKRSFLTKSPTQIFDFQLAALALKINHSVIHYD